MARLAKNVLDYLLSIKSGKVVTSEAKRDVLSRIANSMNMRREKEKAAVLDALLALEEEGSVTLDWVGGDRLAGVYVTKRSQRPPAKRKTRQQASKIPKKGPEVTGQTASDQQPTPDEGFDIALDFETKLAEARETEKRLVAIIQQLEQERNDALTQVGILTEQLRKFNEALEPTPATSEVLQRYSH